MKRNVLAVSALALTMAVSAQAGWFSSNKEDAKANKAQPSKIAAQQNQAGHSHGDRFNRAAAFNQQADQNFEPVDPKDASYAIGFTMGNNFKRQNMEINSDELIKGFQAGIGGEKGRFDEAEARKILMNFQRQVMKQRMEQRKKDAEENKTAGEAWLNQNKAKPGVVTTESGLQYKVIAQGNGNKPAENDTVKVTYSGRLINGDVFSSSDDPAKPATFRLNQVIPAWKEALQLMPQGAEWELYVPAELAYGARGAGQKIGPNSTLIFKIKLLEIQKNEEKQQASENANDATQQAS